MKALIYTAPENLIYADFEDPTVKNDEVLVQVCSVGICGSDMHAFLGHDERRPAPLILGHEVSGIVKSGEKLGKKVAINPLVTCSQCSYCLNGLENLCPKREIISMPPRQGAFAQYLSIPSSNLIDLPEKISLDSAALIEPIACGFHAVKLALKNLTLKDEINALVIGGGAVGFGAALSFKALGINNIEIAEPNQQRREYLSNLSSFKLLDSNKINLNKHYSIVIDAAGFDSTRKMASEIVKPGGVIAHIGLGSATGGLNIRRMTLQEIKFIGTYTYSKADFKEASEALFNGKIENAQWYEIRELKDGLSAFNDLKNGRVNAPKIILKPS